MSADLWLWAAGAVVAAALTFDVGLLVAALFIATPIFERRPAFNAARPPAGPDAEPVRFRSADGTSLAGAVYRPAGEPRGVIVFCPEFGGSHRSAPEYAAGLLDAGFAVFAFDFRGQGDSDAQPSFEPMHWLTRRETADALAAVRYVGSRPEFADLPLGMFGISRGGNAALAVAAADPRVRAVAADGAFSADEMMALFATRWIELYLPTAITRLIPDWHLRRTLRFARRASELRRGVRYVVLERLLPRLRNRPVLLISGGKDTYVPPLIAERLRSRIGPTCGPVCVIPGAKHNQARLSDPAGYDRRLAEFFGPIADAESANRAARLVSVGR